MQLQNLARQILVDAELALRHGVARHSAPRGRKLRSRRIGADRVLIVEKGDHRRMLFNRGQQFHEAAVDVRPDRFVLQSTGQAENGSLVG